MARFRESQQKPNSSCNEIQGSIQRCSLYPILGGGAHKWVLPGKFVSWNLQNVAEFQMCTTYGGADFWLQVIYIYIYIYIIFDLSQLRSYHIPSYAAVSKNVTMVLLFSKVSSSSWGYTHDYHPNKNQPAIGPHGLLKCLGTRLLDLLPTNRCGLVFMGGIDTLWKHPKCRNEQMEV